MTPSQHIILIGMPASGKSIIGKQLAKDLGITSYDMDKMIEERQGMSIAAIFSSHGEGEFRKYESEILAELLQRKAGVIASGGGVVLLPHNRELIKQQELVFYIKLAAATIIRNLADSSHRPLIDNAAPATSAAEARKRRVVELLAQRSPLYQECAKFTIAADEQSVQQISAAILAKVPRQ